MTRHFVRFAALALLFVAQSAAAQAVVLSPTARGWYTNLGNHTPGNQNFAAGYCSPADCPPAGPGEDIYRNFFTFDLSGVTGVVTAAVLDVETRSTYSPDATETYELHGVTTPAATLISGTSSVATYDDLGDGPLLASAVSAIPPLTYLDAFFGPTGVAAVNSALGTTFAVGGQLSTLSPRGTGFAEIFFLDSSFPTLASVSLVLDIARCPNTPAAGCNAASKSAVKIKSSVTPAKNSMGWSWKSPSGSGGFGDPTANTAYALCFYKDGALSLSSTIANGTGWTGADGKFKYKNVDANGDGIVGAKVSLAASGKAKIKVKAKGVQLTLPPLPYQPAQLRVQLLLDSATGSACSEATFNTPFVQDDAAGFRAKY